MRYGTATKIEKASRQQRTYLPCAITMFADVRLKLLMGFLHVIGKQRKNRAKTVRGTAKTKGGAKEKKK